jgi:tRNA (guanine-N7-)-methyltransferase
MEQIGLQELPVLKHTTDLYRSDLVDPVLSIKTYYENKYLSVDKNINYVQWKLNKIS